MGLVVSIQDYSAYCKTRLRGAALSRGVCIFLRLGGKTCVAPPPVAKLKFFQ